MSRIQETDYLSTTTESYTSLLSNDPIDWNAWNKDTLQKAQELDRPIFLSIGSVLNEWCHQMHRESFLNEEIAETLNQSYVPIAVDSQSRSDIDEVFQSVCRAVESIGGWPLSIWLTPSARPFYIGTYFPPEHTDYAPAFGEILNLISEKWESPAVRSEIDQRADDWIGYAQSDLGTPAPATDVEWSDVRERVIDVTLRAADMEYGGSGTGAKAPEPARSQFLAKMANDRAREDCQEAVTTTLDAITTSQLRDPIGGGFFEHSTERDWSNPVVSLSLGTNVELIRAFLQADRLVDHDRFKLVSQDGLDWIDRGLTTTEGTCVNGLGPLCDAASNPDQVSDSYYRWTWSELEEILEDEVQTEFVHTWIDLPGETTDGSIPRVENPIDELSQVSGHSSEAVSELRYSVRRQLREARRRRGIRVRDDRVNPGTNGLTAALFAEASVALDDPKLASRSRSICEAIQNQFWAEERLLGRAAVNGDVKQDSVACLDDYAFFGMGSMLTYQVTGDAKFLDYAEKLSDAILREFWDGERMTYRPTRIDENLLNPQITRDRTVPSAIAYTIDLLSALDENRPDHEDNTVAKTICGRYIPRIGQDLISHYSLTMAGEQLYTER